jgi:hypothetical protein
MASVGELVARIIISGRTLKRMTSLLVENAKDSTERKSQRRAREKERQKGKKEKATARERVDGD